MELKKLSITITLILFFSSLNADSISPNEKLLPYDVVMCKSDDDSLYCQLMKVINVIFGFVFLSAIFYFIYMVFMTKKGYKRRR